jgi:hypothetical protein
MEATTKTGDKKTGRIAKLFCQKCLRVQDATIVDDRSIVGTGLEFTFTNELAVIGVVNQMCLAYDLSMEIEKHKQNWVVTIRRPNERTFTASPFATSPILRRAVLQAAIYAHDRYVAWALGSAQGGETTRH